MTTFKEAMENVRDSFIINIVVTGGITLYVTGSIASAGALACITTASMGILYIGEYILARKP